MKFHRFPRMQRRPITGRRLSAARRALQGQRDAVALFPELWPTETPEQRIDLLETQAMTHWQRIRDHSAQTWRRARAQFRQLSPAQQARVLERWLSPNWAPPADAHYFADLVHTASANPQDNP